MNKGITTKAGGSGQAKPIINYPGGKARMAAHILRNIPPHKTFIEVFAGGLGVLTKKPKEGVEIVNDIDSNITNLYAVVRSHSDGLIKELSYFPNSRELFERFKCRNCC